MASMAVTAPGWGYPLNEHGNAQYANHINGHIDSSFGASAQVTHDGLAQYMNQMPDAMACSNGILTISFVASAPVMHNAAAQNNSQMLQATAAVDFLPGHELVNREMILPGDQSELNMPKNETAGQGDTADEYYDRWESSMAMRDLCCPCDHAVLDQALVDNSLVGNDMMRTGADGQPAAGCGAGQDAQGPATNNLLLANNLGMPAAMIGFPNAYQAEMPFVHRPLPPLQPYDTPNAQAAIPGTSARRATGSALPTTAAPAAPAKKHPKRPGQIKGRRANLRSHKRFCRPPNDNWLSPEGCKLGVCLFRTNEPEDWKVQSKKDITVRCNGQPIRVLKLWDAHVMDRQVRK